jgi:hypothetical protein
MLNGLTDKLNLYESNIIFNQNREKMDLIPANHTPFPNIIIETQLSKLNEIDLKVLLVMYRLTFKIYFWPYKATIHKIIELTGLKIDKVDRSLKKLLKKKILFSCKEMVGSHEIECYYTNIADFIKPKNPSRN